MKTKRPGTSTSRSSSARTESPQFLSHERFRSSSGCISNCSGVVLTTESYYQEASQAGALSETSRSRPEEPVYLKSLNTAPSPRRSNRLTKPPVPQLSSRSQRLKPNDSNDTTGSSGAGQSFSLNAGGNFMFNHPMYPLLYPGQFMMPVTTLYGQVQGQQMAGATVVYTSGVIPPNTTSIIFIPVPGQVAPGVTSFTPSPPPRGVTPPSECSEPIRLDQPLVVVIERNVFKQWFDVHMPAIMREIPHRVKRYKSVETFLHWLSSRKKYEQLDLNILIRITEVGKLMSEAKNMRNFRIFSYEHLLDPKELPAGKSLRDLAIPNRKEISDSQRVSVCRCLEEACRKLLAALKSPEIS